MPATPWRIAMRDKSAGVTQARFRDILYPMKILCTAALLVLLAPAAWAADLDLGFARPGMTLDEFRASAWPAGVSVRCSGEADLPPESDNVRLSVPGPVARLGGTRCGLFRRDGAGWATAPLTLAGTDAEVWGKFFPDQAGTPRLLHLVMRLPPQAFDAVADHFAERFGPPELRQTRLARWQTQDAEAAIIEDGAKSMLAFVIDTRLQAALNQRVSHQPRHPAAKDKQK